MKRSVGLGAVLASLTLAGPANAEDWSGDAPASVKDTAETYAITQALFEERTRAVLTARLAERFTSAENVYVRCPKSEGGDGVDEDTYSQLCESLISDGTVGTQVTVSFKVEDGAMTYEAFGTGPASLRPAKCSHKTFGSRMARDWQIRSMKATTFTGCGGSQLMAGDMIFKSNGTSATVRKVLPRQFRAYSHGTNRAGFDDLYVWNCTSKKRAGRRFAVTCKNGVGASFYVLLFRGL